MTVNTFKVGHNFKTIFNGLNLYNFVIFSYELFNNSQMEFSSVQYFLLN